MHGSRKAVYRQAVVVTLALNILVSFWWTLPAALQASDMYYQTLMPPLPPLSPNPVRNPGTTTGTPSALNQLFGKHANLFGETTGQVGRVRKIVVLADEPRQAAASALQNPCLAVTFASYALAGGLEAEADKSVTCVDLYFEGVTFAWHFLQSPGAVSRPEYATAWQMYHRNLAHLLSAAQRFGRLDATSGLRVVTPVGEQTIRTAYSGFVWRPQDFVRVELPDPAAPQKLKNHFSCPGFGVPLVVVRENLPLERFLNDETPFNATAILRPSLAALAGQAPPVGASSSHGPLEFYDPLRVHTVQFNDQCIAMATDTSAAIEFAIRNSNYSPWEGLVRPGSAEAGQEKLFMLEPYQPGKYPLVFVHGFFSSPRIWAHFANELLAQPELRNRIQLMAYRYPTGRPFVESASILRRELYAMKDRFDPCGEDPGISNTALVGHSMGGLVSKLIVTHSDDRLWYSVAKRPFEELNTSEAQRHRLRDLFYFKPVPFVRRVCFMGSPHGGAQLASELLGRCSAKFVQQPTAELIEHQLLIGQNPGFFKTAFSQRIPTSIDMMQPGNCQLRTIRVLCPGENVQLHSIIGVGCVSPLSGIGDGVVARRSAQHHSVSTEKRVHTTHGGLHESEEAMKELQCIIRRHILEANDVPSVDGYEFAVPEFEVPIGTEPDCEELAPDVPCPSDLSCPVDILGPENIPCPGEPIMDGIWPEYLCPDESALSNVEPWNDGLSVPSGPVAPDQSILPPADQQSILVPPASSVPVLPGDSTAPGRMVPLFPNSEASTFKPELQETPQSNGPELFLPEL